MKGLPLLSTAMLAIAACSSEGGPAPTTSAPGPTASAASSAAAGVTPPKSPDAILQARVRETARNIEAIEAARGPGGLWADDFHWDANPRRDPGAEVARPQVRMGEVTAIGKLDVDLVKRIVRQNYGRFRYCYEDALEWDAALEGRVTTTFVIDDKGAVSTAVATTDIKDSMLAVCVKRGFSALEFPEPESGVVKVTFPIIFKPGEAKAAAPGATEVDGGIDNPSAPFEPPRKPAEDQDWPIVAIEGDAVLLEGAEVAKTNALGEARRPQRVDGLYEKLREYHWKWELGHEMSKHPGVAGLRVSSATPAFVFKSVFQTMALAGYPTILVQSAEQRDQIVELGAQLPLVSAPGRARAASIRRNDPAFFIELESSETSIVTKIEQRVVRTEKVDVPAKVGPTLCQTWEKDGRYREAGEARRDRLVLSADNELETGAILNAARQALSCTRSESKAPAVWVHFAVR